MNEMTCTLTDKHLFLCSTPFTNVMKKEYFKFDQCFLIAAVITHEDIYGYHIWILRINTFKEKYTLCLDKYWIISITMMKYLEI